MEKTTLTTQEVADYIGVSKDLVYAMVRKKEVPHVRVGTRLLFKKDSIERWLTTKEEESIKNTP
ncbi:hypothetical protein GCM10010954_23930 [Halobacillus andaensis]|uniref:Helix-turn-helix domain-containing protein n=1 Tax=Halobacillus andaensis TaxID=1176239 RepID=A0A917B6T4_HALAA|nr:helix-turn-helix domain-containing protein [Halobacillus andaensis]MBP2006017.1 excisionase family DNA binding protein [Halobacillus andaensis]GGF24264.1 hypothetical protein GCM10010954_23930 [Halobacillus andaensis]